MTSDLGCSWKTIANAVEDLIVICDSSHTILWANDSFTRTFGLQESSHHSQELFAFLTPFASNSALIGKVAQDCDTLGEFQGTLTFATSTSPELILRVRLQRRDAGWLLTATNQTEVTTTNRRAHEAMAEVRLWREILEQHCLLSITDRQGKIVDVNQGFCAISGYSREELIGQDHRIIRSGHHPKSFWRDMWHSLLSGIAWRGEVCNRRKDGQLYWVHATNIPITNETGEVVGLASVRFDITEKKRLEAAQHAQAEDLEAIFDAVPGVIYRCQLDEHWTMDWISDAIEHVSGYPAAEFANNSVRTFFSIIHPDDRKSVTQQIEEAVRNCGSYSVRYRLMHRNGEIRWVDERGSAVLRGSLEKSSALIGFIVDVTEHQRLEAELLTQKRILEGVIESNTTGYTDWNIREGKQFFSPSWLRMIGYEPGELPEVPETWEKLIHPEDLPVKRTCLDNHFKSQGSIPYYVKLRFLHKNGDTRWMLCTGQVVEWSAEGEPLRMASCHIDITQGQEAEDRLSLAIKSSNLGLWDWDIESGQTYFSDNYFTMLGYEPGELPSTYYTWINLCHPDDVARVITCVQVHLRDGSKLYSCEHRLQAKSGEWYWVRAVGEVVEFLPDGSPKRMVGVHIDVQQLREMVARAEAANHSKSEFLANMSHEIRTPMTAILGYADLLGGDEQFATNKELASDAVRSIRNNANHLLAIINDILDMSKIEAGQMKVELINSDVVAVTREVADLLLPRARGKGIDLRIKFDSPIPQRIQSDPTRLRQILLNLAGNAVKFTEIGSVQMHLSCDESQGLMRIDISDSGIGMSPEQVRIISRFESFSQADTSMTRKFGGTGLGLRISKSLANMLGGDIDVVSTAGKGSTFTVTVSTGNLTDVPWRSQDELNGIAVQLSPTTSMAGSTGKLIAQALEGKRILLAEDGPDNQKLISFHLKKAGANVFVVANGELAVNYIETCSALDELPDIVLMDMQMPILDGYCATQALRQLGYSIPIIALTAHAMQGDERKCRDAGCNDYLTKPIDKQMLVSTCLRWIQQPHDPVIVEQLTLG